MDTIVKYRQFLIMLILWLIVALFGGPINIVFIPLCVIFLKLRNRYTEMLLGFWFVCTFSDSRLDLLSSFEQAKYVYIVLLTIFLLLDAKQFTPINRFFIRFLPFILVAFYCISHTPAANLSNSIFKTFSYMCLLFITPNYVSKSYRDNGYDFIRLFIILAAFILFLGLFSKLFIPSLVTFENRFRGLLGNPNGLGIYCLVVFILFALVNRSLPDLFSKQEKILVFILLFLSLILSGSRTALVASLIYIMFSYLTRISPILGFIILIAILMGYEYIDINLVTVAKSVGIEKYLRTETLQNAAGRYIAWKFAWDNISKNIFMGHGFEYTNYLFSLHQKELSDMGHQGNAHNSYLTFWLDTGIVGLFLYLWAFVGFFIKAARKNKVIIAALFAILFSIVFESYLTSSLNPYTIVIIIILTIFTSDEILPIKAQDIIPLH